MSTVVAAAAPPPPAAAAQDDDIRYFAQILENPANDSATRVGAAERLLRIGAPEALEVLEDALSSGEAGPMRPVLRAFAALPDVCDRLARGAVEAVPTAPDEVLDLLAAVIAHSSSRVPPSILAGARDRQTPVHERLSAIRVLGAFTSIEAGDALIELADPQSGDDDRIPAAALENLRRLTSLDLGEDYDRWRTFWAQARNSSPEAWALVQRYQARITTLEDRTARLASDYVALLREHYRVLTVDDQLARLSTDLQHTLAPVRAFALERIGRLLRDSYRIPEELEAQIMTALEDAQPALRAQAALLLDELDEPALGLHLAARLPAETDTDVRATYFVILARRPAPEALPAILAALRDETLAEPATAALWRLLRDHSLDTDQLEEVRTTVFAELDETSAPALVRVATFVAPEPELPALEAMLDGDDDAMCAAVAAALCARGREKQLLDRVDDERIRPWAIRVVAAGKADADRFAKIVELAPSPTEDELVDEWRELTRTLAHELDPEDILAAADRLEGVPAAGDPLRVNVLMRAAMLPAGTLTSDERVEIHLRLMPLLMKGGEARRALELIEILNGVADHRLEQLHLQAAMLAQEYDDPVVKGATLRAKVDAFIASIDVDPAGAEDIAQLIEPLLAENDETDLRLEFDAAIGRLNARLVNEDEDAGSP